MRMRELHSTVAKREGGKHQASIGDVREIISKTVDILAEEQAAGEALTLIMICREAKKRADKIRRKKARKK